jgi:TonB family protein
MFTDRSPMVASLIIHISAAIALFTIFTVRTTPTPLRTHPIIALHLAPYRAATKTPPGESGGGGGGRDFLPASKGRAPKPSPRPCAPPMILTKAPEPALLVTPALVAAPDMSVANLPQWGDPLSRRLLGSSGAGGGGGIGPGHDGGIGPGKGPGWGPGDHPGTGGSESSSSAGISAPELLYKVEPEFSDEARRAKHYGTVILLVDVDASGRAVNIRVVRPLGLGLDEKAVEAVSRWKFRPGRRNGKAVTVAASVEVNFHLL